MDQRGQKYGLDCWIILFLTLVFEHGSWFLANHIADKLVDHLGPATNQMFIKVVMVL